MIMRTRRNVEYTAFKVSYRYSATALELVDYWLQNNGRTCKVLSFGVALYLKANRSPFKVDAVILETYSGFSYVSGPIDDVTRLRRFLAQFYDVVEFESRTLERPQSS